jgi:hypothetical protein
MKKLIHAVVAVACLSGLAVGVTAAQQVAAAQDRTCRDYGLKPGTDPYANCRLEMSRQQLARDIALDQEAATPIFPPMKTCSYNSNTNGRPDARHAQLHVPRHETWRREAQLLSAHRLRPRWDNGRCTPDSCRLCCSVQVGSPRPDSPVMLHRHGRQLTPR